MEDAPACYRHPDQQTRIRCQRCDRPICPQCMVPGSVGFQCPECVNRGAKETRQRALPHGGERSANPRLTSFVLIGINLAVWLGILATGSYAGPLFNHLSLTPLGRCVATDGGNYLTDPTACASTIGQYWVDGVANGSVWQIITSGFAHVEIWHILFNMMLVFMVGPNIEQILGRARYLAVYFVALLGGSTGVMLFSEPVMPTLGASVATFGLLGALLLLAYRHKGDYRNILMWLGLNIALSFIWTSVSWQGHLGGLVGGAAVAALLIYLPKEKRSLQWPLIGAIVAVLVGLIVFRALQLA